MTAGSEGAGPDDGARDDRPADLLVRGARRLVTMAGPELDGGWVAIRDGRVTAVGGVGGVGGPAPGPEPAARRVIDAGGCLVTPGLINTHHHMFQNLTRSFAPVVNQDLFTWLHELGSVWQRLDEEASYVSAWVGLAELALGGCTTTSDHLHVHPSARLVDAEIAAAREVGLRLHAVRGAMDLSEKDGGIPPDVVAQDVDDILDDSQRLVARYHDRSPDAAVQVALGPSSPFDASERLFVEGHALAERLDVRFHTHLAQDRGDEEFCLARFGRRPVEQFEHLGLGTARTWVAHCVQPSAEEIARLGRWGTGVAHCPSSIMLICGGVAPVAEMRAAGVPVGLGCDGSASTDHASLWLEARTALLVGRMRGGPTAMSARDVLEMATVGSATCLGRTGELGVLTPGACGDLVVWPLEGPAFAGALTDPVEAWLRCGPVAARHTVVGGRLVVEEGRFVDPRLDDLLRRHAAIAGEWQGVA